MIGMAFTEPDGSVTYVKFKETGGIAYIIHNYDTLGELGPRQYPKRAKRRTKEEMAAVLEQYTKK